VARKSVPLARHKNAYPSRSPLRCLEIRSAFCGPDAARRADNVKRSFRIRSRVPRSYPACQLLVAALRRIQRLRSASLTLSTTPEVIISRQILPYSASTPSLKLRFLPTTAQRLRDTCKFVGDRFVLKFEKRVSTRLSIPLPEILLP
jgi:hypothetical protein